MSQRSVPRSGSLQYWPRKRAKKFLPRVSWKNIARQASEKKGLLGSIAYKAGMSSAVVKDNTPDSLTKGKKIIIPVTILECPPVRILSVRFYKNGNVAKEILNDSLDKSLKRKIKLPKKGNAKEQVENAEKELDKYDDIKVIAYSLVGRTGLKKTPDLSEIALAGTMAEKLQFAKSRLNGEILFSEIFSRNSLVDARGVTQGRGFQGPVRRFGISLRQHKSEKGTRRPGSLGPWHPSYVTFKIAMAGQTGFFTRMIPNLKVIDVKKAEKPLQMGAYGNIHTEYVIIRGSVQGPSKRQLVLTAPLRKTKRQEKKNFELISIRGFK
ncbi:MAG TPA: 50S ribosomal protein L3 [Candidatus Nanoarchaeia archaeon]|nr:50S ribosomal protein L3 [Candidatus Nanoarchaeia archaeon]